MDHLDDHGDGPVQYVRGVNWAPDSTDEDEDPMADVAEDSQSDMDHLDDETEAVDALESFAVKFQSDQVRHEACNLMLPVLLPHLYGEHDDDVNSAATSLLWMSRGYGNHGKDAKIVDADQNTEAKNTEAVKMSMFKIIFLFMYDN